MALLSRVSVLSLLCVLLAGAGLDRALALGGDDRAVLAGALGALWLAHLPGYAVAASRLRRQAELARAQALRDALTGLPNRRALQERAATELDAGRALTLLVLDLDGFHDLNDTLGHDAGDRLLRLMGPRLQAALPPGSDLARLGGDEFGALLPPDAPAGAGPDAAARVRERLEAAFLVDGLRLRVQASVGVARFPDHARTAEELLRRAEVAMYEAKRTGSGWRAYDPARDTSSRMRVALADDLRRALDQEELVLHFQPKADSATGTVTGVEALVRWSHPEHGLIAPDVFLPLAERSQLIRPLTRYVLRRALAQAVRWRDAGLDLTVAVNLATADVLDPALPGEVRGMLAVAGLEPGALVLELTENVVVADPVRVTGVLRRLRELGVGLALDDFGTGASSLAHLRALAVGELKVDRSFVDALRSSTADRAIVRSTLGLARDLGMRTVGEGVEDDATWSSLAAMGCDQIQGFGLSRPLPAEQLTPWLEARRVALGPAAA